MRVRNWGNCFGARALTLGFLSGVPKSRLEIRHTPSVSGILHESTSYRATLKHRCMGLKRHGTSEEPRASSLGLSVPAESV